MSLCIKYILGNTKSKKSSSPICLENRHLTCPTEEFICVIPLTKKHITNNVLLGFFWKLGFVGFETEKPAEESKPESKPVTKVSVSDYIVMPKPQENFVRDLYIDMEMQEKIEFPGLPLAVYREIAAHLNQLAGVEVGLISQTSLEFDYNESQIAGLWISWLPNALEEDRQRFKQIVAYYQNR